MIGVFAASLGVVLVGGGWAWGPASHSVIMSATPARVSWEKSPRDTTAVPSAGSSSTIDTGAFVPGRRDFTRYATVGLCLSAARETRSIARRQLAVQIARDTLEHDTTGLGGARPIARACSARFTLATTPARDHYRLFELALYAGNAPLAQAVLADFVTHASTPRERAEVLRFGIDQYLNFGWRAAAESLAAQADAQGPSARLAQLSLHRALMDEFHLQEGDSARLRTEVARIFALTEQSPKILDLDSYEAERWAFWYTAQQLVLTDPSQLPPLAARAQRELGQYERSPDVTQGLTWAPWSTMTLQAVQDRLVHKMYRYQQRAGLVSAPRLTANYWFPPPGRPASDTLRPKLGKLNLICRNWGISDEIFNDDLAKYSLRSWLWHWFAEYGVDQLEVTLVVPARGYTNLITDHANANYLFHTLAEESEAWRWYFHDYAQLPVTVAVQHAVTEWLPPPDGRRLSQHKIQFNQFWMMDPDMLSHHMPDTAQVMASLSGLRPGEWDGQCVLVDPQGQIWHTSLEADPLQNTDGALKLYFHQHPAPTRPTLGSH